MVRFGVDSYVLLTRLPLSGDRTSEIRNQIFDLIVDANLFNCLEIDL